jgi:hypothetical protein
MLFESQILDSLQQNQRMAYLFGCPLRYLYLADAEYEGLESFKIHRFQDITLTGDDQKREILAKDQLASLEPMMNGAFKRSPPSLIVINSKYVAANDSEVSGNTFLYHLVCSLANKRLITKDTTFDFQYISLLDQYPTVELTLRKILCFGTVTDDMAVWEYNKLVQLLFKYENFTRILYCSVTELGKLLTEKLRMGLGYPDYVFNISPKFKTEIKSDVPKKKRRKKSSEEVLMNVVSTPRKVGDMILTQVKSGVANV